MIRGNQYRNPNNGQQVYSYLHLPGRAYLGPPPPPDLHHVTLRSDNLPRLLGTRSGRAPCPERRRPTLARWRRHVGRSAGSTSWKSKQTWNFIVVQLLWVCVVESGSPEGVMGVALYIFFWRATVLDSWWRHQMETSFTGPLCREFTAAFPQWMCSWSSTAIKILEIDETVT